MTPKLLLADDSVTIQRVIELTFADEDVQVLAVGDGQQAIDRVKSDPPDIVLADVGMPERDGYEVAAFIKNDPQLAHIPVLLLTGAFEPVDEVRARAVGCDGVLVKPFEPQMVISRVRDLLAGQREAARPQTPVAKVATPLVVETGRHQAPPAQEDAGPTALEAYFDRLDAALAIKTATPSVRELDSRPMPAEPEKALPPDAPGPVPAPPRPVAAVPQPAPVAAPAGPVTRPTEMRPQTPERQQEAEPVQSELSLQEAFAALLAAEQAPRSPAAAPAAPAAVSDDTIEEICRRVIARMGDESMRAAVLDAADRLVREEIARIKSQA